MRKNNLWLLAGALTVVSCSNNPQQEVGQTYPTIVVQTDTVEVVESYSASIRGCQDVDIYPQVSGSITKLCVKEGERVHKGQELFVIDQVPYRAALRSAVANVQAAEAGVASARLDYESKQELFREDVISEYELSMAKNALEQAEATLEQAEAAEIDARNNLSYTEIKSPVEGTVGTLPFRVGTLVSPTMPQPLTTVSDNRHMYVYFSMTENELRSLLRKYGNPDNAIAQMPEIELELNDGTIYDRKGRIETFSGLINPQTGSISVRAVFENPDRMLWSGGVGNVVMRRVSGNQVVIPQDVVMEIQDKTIGYKVVHGKAKAVFITVESLADGKRYAVKEGLFPGDTIVSKGVGRIQEGMEITIGKENEQ